MADSIFGINGDNRAWDGIWNARVRHSEIGWTIEIEIPFRTLNFDPDNETWGFNFQRTVPQEQRQYLDGVGAKPGPHGRSDRCEPYRRHRRPVGHLTVSRQPEPVGHCMAVTRRPARRQRSGERVRRRHRVSQRPVATAIRCARSAEQLRSRRRLRAAPRLSPLSGSGVLRTSAAE